MFARRNYLNTAIALSSTLTISIASTLPAFAQVSFNDVESSYWANQYVQSLTTANIISGFPDGSFRPDEEMTRAQFASILSGGFPKAAVRESISFNDVPDDHWAAGAIASAYQKGFLSGYPDGTFGLDQPITRLEVLVSLTNGLGLTTTADTAALIATFSDNDDVPEWAFDAIAAATEQQLIVNYPNVKDLNPGRNATRAEIAAIAHQALVANGQATAIQSPYLATATTAPTPVTNPPASNPPASNPGPTTPVVETTSDDFSELVALLGSNDTAASKSAADTLAATGAAAVPELTTALESDSVQTRAAAAYALNEIGADAQTATPTLLEVIKDDDELVRALATSTLTKVGLDQSVLTNLLVAAIQNESGLVKDVAADALVGIGGDAVPALGTILKNESANTLAKQTAATLIGDISKADNLGDAAVNAGVSVLADMLNDGDSDVRKAAAKALGDFGPLADVAIPALSQTLLGDSAKVTQTAAGSLVKIGQQSVPGLTEALTSDNPLTQLYAADALWTLTEDSSLILPTVVSLLGSGDVETRELAALSLTYLGRRALPALPEVRRLLSDQNSTVRDIAWIASAILRNRNEPQPSLGLLNTEPEELTTVSAVAEVVSQIWQ
ncbi:MAG: S-layer homology domain-containing protein [Cyanobacteria bacterium J06560_5]